MKNLVIFTVFSMVIYKGKSYSKWFKYTKFSDFRDAMALQKSPQPQPCRKTYQNQNKNQSLSS